MTVNLRSVSSHPVLRGAALVACIAVSSCGDDGGGGELDAAADVSDVAHDVVADGSDDTSSDATDASDGTIDAPPGDAVDDARADAIDATDVSDAADVPDASDVVDAADVSDAADAVDVADSAPDAIGPMCGDGVCDEGELAGTCADDCAIIAIDSGSAHTCVVHAGGQVSCWGSSESIRAGGAGNLRSATRISGLNGVTAVAAGDEHTCVLRDGGEVWCWGANGYGQAGSQGVADWVWPPARVGALDGYTGIAAGGSTTCVWGSADRIARCWGRGDMGQTGRGAWVRRLLDPLVYGVAVDVVSASIGDGHGCVRISSGGGSMSCMGRNDHGQLGTDDRVWRALATRIFTTTSTASAFAVGDGHTCATYPALGGPAIACWGANHLGQLGGRPGADRLDAVSVSGAAPAGVDIAAGANHTCMIIEATGREDSVRCWGDNSFEQCGVTPVRITDNPDPIDGTIGAQMLSAGDAFSCAVLAASQVVCWGSNMRGQLGTSIGFETTSSSAVRVGGI